MRAACLIMLVALMLQVTFSIYTTSNVSTCCLKSVNRLKSENIKSYYRTNENACKNKAFIVQLKTGKSVCANTTSKVVLSAIEKFDSNKKIPNK